MKPVARAQRSTRDYAYTFDLRTNQLDTSLVANPNAGREHVFKAYRMDSDPRDSVRLREGSLRAGRRRSAIYFVPSEKDVQTRQ